MARKISDSCIKCGTCAGICPVKAIVEGEEHYEVDASKCVDCGACQMACPVKAIDAE